MAVVESNTSRSLEPSPVSAGRSALRGSGYRLSIERVRRDRISDVPYDDTDVKKLIQAVDAFENGRRSGDEREVRIPAPAGETPASYSLYLARLATKVYGGDSGVVSVETATDRTQRFPNTIPCDTLLLFVNRDTTCQEQQAFLRTALGEMATPQAVLHVVPAAPVENL